MTFTPTDEQTAARDAARTQKGSLMLSAYAGCAKALRNDQRVVTPSGYCAIGDLTTNDSVIGKDGKAYPVLGVFPQGEKECFELKFSDGSIVIATEDHIWEVQRTDDRLKGKTRLVTTAELFRKPRVVTGPASSWGDGTRAYWFFPMTAPVHFSKREENFIDPWLLGILLGDGHLMEHGVTFSTADVEILDRVTTIVMRDYELQVKLVAAGAYDYRISRAGGMGTLSGVKGFFNPLVAALQQYGLAGMNSQFKFIPKNYLLSTPEERLALLQGILDSDGHADNNSRAVFGSSSYNLIEGVKFLVESLGGTASEYKEYQTSGLMSYRLGIKLPDGVSPFWVPRKRKIGNRQREPYRALESVTKVGLGQATCIAVGSPDKLFLTENFIPTHNTTTLELIGKEIKNPALALAFNVTIKDELAKRFAPNFQVKTMNGLGYGALMRALPGVTFGAPDGRKLGKVINLVAKSAGIELLSEQWDQTKELVTRVMNSGLVPKDEGQMPLIPDNQQSWERLMSASNIFPEDQEFFYSLAYKVLEQNNWLVTQGQASFDDQVYYSVCVSGKFPQFPVMMVDEAQDLSPLNHAMLRLAKRPDGRLIVCGDPKQAIYAFRGADSESMMRLRELRPDSEWTDLPLTLTFRCPKLIVQRQQRHAPGFRAAESNRAGSFLELGEEPEAFGQEREWDWSDLQATVGEHRSLAVLCRNNAPLISLAFKLLRKRVSVRMIGRDIGTGLVALSRKLFKEDGTSRDAMKGLLADWEESEVSGLLAMDKEEAVDGIRDKAESLRAVISFADVEDAKALRYALKVLFEKNDGQVTLSTIHKSKGLEWDAVLHLDPWRVPSKMAKLAAIAGNDTPMKQELNLKYVCETRTKDLLLEANIKGML